ncbi:MAG: CdaR family protein [Synergistaceae bacterium]|nr:CdaR family protein [Synergistaceae bacterium]
MFDRLKKITEDGKTGLKNKWRSMKEKSEAFSSKLNYRGEHFIQSRIFLCGVSVFISVVIWAFVAFDGNSDASRTVNAEIKYVNLTRGLSLYTLDKNVEIKLEGRISALSTLQPSDVAAEVDLANLQTGRYNLPVRLETPSFARIRSWRPALVEVEIYRHVERTIQITPKVSGAPPEGMVVGSVELTPSEAVVSGPEADVMSVQELEASVPLDRLDSKGKINAEIMIKTAINEANATLMPTSRLTLTPRNTEASVTFENEIVGERIPVRVSVVGQPQEGLQVESIKVIPESISIRGSSEAVKKMQSLVLPPVDISGLDQNIQLMIPMRPAQLDPDVEISGPDRARVEILLSKKMGVRTFTNVPLRIEGSAEAREWRLTPSTVSVTIEGPQMAIDELTGAQPPCELYIDVSNIVSEQAELPVLVKNLKREFQVVKIEPEQVLITTAD